MSTAHVVVGLGFGDEGKGTVVDYLVRTKPVSAVIRWNGGPQASHHVVLPDGRWHGFSQFGAGTFHPNVRTHLAKGMLVEPWNLMNEELALRGKGVSDALARTTIDPRCVVVGPWHKLLGQMREAVRGKGRHGSVGMGVGVAVEFSRQFGDATLTMGDLAGDLKTIREKVAQAVEAVLKTTLTTSLAEVVGVMSRDAGALAAADLLADFKARGRLDVEALSAQLHEFGRLHANTIRHDEDQIPEFLRRGDVVFEGAQGLLLDPILGFPPHVTKTRMTTQAARALAPGGHFIVIGVLRAFGHRHGAGPFPSERPDSGDYLKGEHNSENRWQGPFRTGDFDLLTASYAVRECGINGVALTCLDRLGDEPRVVMNWRHPGPAPSWLSQRALWKKDGDGVLILRLKPPLAALSHEWSDFVAGCAPAEVKVCRGADGLLSCLKDNLGARIAITSWGPTWKDKEAR